MTSLTTRCWPCILFLIKAIYLEEFTIEQQIIIARSKNVKFEFSTTIFFGQFEMSCSGSLRTDGWAISTFFVLFTDPLSSISYSKGCSKYLVTVFCIVLLSNHKKEGFELTLYRLLPCYETLESSLESCNVKVPVWSTSNVWSWVE